MGIVMGEQVIATQGSLPVSPMPLADLPTVRSEMMWRRPPGVAEGAALPCDVVASRWRSAQAGVRAEMVEMTADYHTIAIAMAPTSMALEQCGHTIHDGPVMRGMWQVSGPDQPLRGLFHAPCDFLHIHVASRLLLRSAESVGRASADPTMLAGRLLAPDRAILRLSEALFMSGPADETLCNLYSEAIGRAIVARLLTLAAQPVRRHSPRRILALARWRLQRVLDYVEANLATTLTLDDLARASGLSRMHFATQFRLATGLRPHEFVLRRRIEQAQAALANSGASQVEVALSVGFEAQSHFCTTFRRIVGQSPGRWRRENRKY